jgi:hypothetical protein
MIYITYKGSEKFVRRQKDAGVDIRWYGWDMIVFRPHKKARRSVRGRFRNGLWVFESTIRPNSHGKWVIKEHLLDV